MKKMIIIGMVNLFLLIVCVLIPNCARYKYLSIYDVKTFILLLLFLLLVIFFNLYFFGFSKKSKNTCFVTWVSIFSLLSYILAGFLLTGCLESRTTDVNNYFELDETYKINGFLKLFPSKELVSNSKVIKYNYVYRTFDGDITNSDIDLYLEIELLPEEYILEKEKIKSIYFNDYNFQDSKIVHNAYFEDSSLELIDGSTNGVYVSPEEYHNYYYRFIAFFDDENRIIYNYSDGLILPFFIDYNRDNLYFR